MKKASLESQRITAEVREKASLVLIGFLIIFLLIKVSGDTTTMDWTSAASLPAGGDGGPVAVFDKNMQNAVVMSPASQFMGASQSAWEGMDKKSHYLSFGLLGTATEVIAVYFSMLLTKKSLFLDSQGIRV